MASRVPGQLRSAPWIAGLLLSCGCVTRTLWGIEPGSSLAVESTRRVEAGLALRAEPDRRTLVADVDRSAALPISRWRLVPVHGAAEVWAVLGSPDRFEVENVDAGAFRRRIDRDLDFRAELDVTLRDKGGAIGTPIAPAALPAGFAAAIRTFDPHALLSDPARAGGSGDLLGECEQRLRTIDAREWLAPADAADRLVGCAWLDEHGNLLDAATRARMLRDLTMDEPFAGHLELLRHLRLVAVVAPSAGRNRAFYSLRPDLVWLRSCFDRDAATGRLHHRSEWLIYPEIPRPLADLALLGRGHLVFDELDGTTEHAIARNLAMKLALTPVTVAIDAVWFVLRSWIVWPLVHDDGDPRRSR